MCPKGVLLPSGSVRGASRHVQEVPGAVPGRPGNVPGESRERPGASWECPGAPRGFPRSALGVLGRVAGASGGAPRGGRERPRRARGRQWERPRSGPGATGQTQCKHMADTGQTRGLLIQSSHRREQIYSARRAEVWYARILMLYTSIRTIPKLVILKLELLISCVFFCGCAYGCSPILI